MQMQPDKYRGMGDALKETVTRYGPGGLYRGVGAPLIGNGFYNAVQFAIFAGAKRWFTNDGRDPGLLRVAGAGAFTGVFVALVEGPQDLFKSQVQAMMVPAKAAAGDAAGAAGAAGGEVKPPKYTGVADCAKKIIGERGLLAGASQGLTATIARNIVGVSAYFYFYEARTRNPRRRGARGLRGER
jgi:solute carrier family 25 carnitine/acylcarnitine transporter 20/29